VCVCTVFCMVFYVRIFLLGSLIFKGRIARRLYKSFGVKGLRLDKMVTALSTEETKVLFKLKLTYIIYIIFRYNLIFLLNCIRL
jgi:hypothetical protein